MTVRKQGGQQRAQEAQQAADDDERRRRVFEQVAGEKVDRTDRQTGERAEDDQTNHTRCDSFNGVFEIFHAETIIDLEGEQGATERHAEKGGESARHAA